MPTATDTTVLNATSPNCTILPTDPAPVTCAVLLGSSFTRVFTIQQPFTIAGFNSANSSVWNGGQIYQTNVGTSVGSITIDGGSFEWLGGTWNAGGGATINNLYVEGDATFDVFTNASTIGSNITVGSGGFGGTLQIGASGAPFELNGNLTLVNDAAINVLESGELSFAQGATSSGRVGGITASASNQNITSNGSIVRNSPNNPAVPCPGIYNYGSGLLWLVGNSKLNVTGEVGTTGYSVYQSYENAYTILGVSSALEVTDGFYQAAGTLETNANPVSDSSSHGYYYWKRHRCRRLSHSWL